ncbi:MAG TPA: cupin domain-containing protein [Gaiellaceae bacterium]|nr:cupin domain-containing protein [Gaiellaceae bacterium]
MSGERRVAAPETVEAVLAGTGVSEHVLCPPLDGSPLELSLLRLEPGAEVAVGSADDDIVLFACGGDGRLEEQALPVGGAVLVPAGDEARVGAGADGLELVRAAVGPDCDRHAALGAGGGVVRAEEAEEGSATGKRSFQVLLGPENGCTRATLFLGRIPPGAAPWHYHLYDEIVWVPEGPGRLHVGDRTEELGPGAAFRLRPRELHVVENAGDRELTVLGLFTPAGSPAAAYLPSS